jgi:aldehyde dehydrogenase (NAD+)
VALQATELANILPSGLVIGEQLVESGGAGWCDHINPATGSPQRHVQLADADDVDRAVRAAQAASATWCGLHPTERRRLLFRLAAVLREHGDELTTISALEAGIPVGFPSHDFCAEWIEYAAGWSDRLEGQVVPLDPARIFDYTLPEPYPVVSVILTWNAPLSSIGMTAGPALAAGCCVVLKPSELAPFSSIRFGQLCLDAGLPPGVVSVLPGKAETGAAIIGHPGVEKISFTGGGATARRIAAACGGLLKPCVLELGGKSACVVFDDADIEAALGTAASVLGLSGQGCSHPTRLLVQEKIYDQFMDLVVARFNSVTVGDPLDQSTMMGPVINEQACARILGMIDTARDAGYPLLAGGQRLGGDLAAGYFLSPTVFGDVAPDAEIAQQEVFGPVLSALRFGDDDEAVAIANGTDYGLAAYVHTTNLRRAHQMARRLAAGSVAINGGSAPAGPGAPFGGIKASGYGVEGGLAGVKEYLRYKNVEIQLER